MYALYVDGSTVLEWEQRAYYSLMCVIHSYVDTIKPFNFTLYNTCTHMCVVHLLPNLVVVYDHMCSDLSMLYGWLYCINGDSLCISHIVLMHHMSATLGVHLFHLVLCVCVASEAILH